MVIIITKQLVIINLRAAKKDQVKSELKTYPKNSELIIIVEQKNFEARTLYRWM